MADITIKDYRTDFKTNYKLYYSDPITEKLEKLEKQYISLMLAVYELVRGLEGANFKIHAHQEVYKKFLGKMARLMDPEIDKKEESKKKEEDFLSDEDFQF